MAFASDEKRASASETMIGVGAAGMAIGLAEAGIETELVMKS